MFRRSFKMFELKLLKRKQTDSKNIRAEPNKLNENRDDCYYRIMFSVWNLSFSLFFFFLKYFQLFFLLRDSKVNAVYKSKIMKTLNYEQFRSNRWMEIMPKK